MSDTVGAHIVLFCAQVELVCVLFNKNRRRAYLSLSGYGNVSPKTHAGRLFCIFYGLFGVPLCLTWISALGKFFGGRAKRLGQFLTKRGVSLVSSYLFTLELCSFGAWIKLILLNLPAYLIANEHLHKYEFSQMVLHWNYWKMDSFWCARSLAKWDLILVSLVLLLTLKTFRTNVHEVPFHRHFIQAPQAQKWKYTVMLVSHLPVQWTYCKIIFCFELLVVFGLWHCWFFGDGLFGFLSFSLPSPLQVNFQF